MDVQLYLYINGAWKEYNPKPASHTHTIANITSLQTILDGIGIAINGKANSSHTHVTADITDLQTKLDGKANGNEVVLSTTENKNILGTTQSVFNVSDKKVWFNKGALFYGTAAAAGLVTRGISGASQTGSAKDHLYINYDGNNTLSRQLVLGAGSIGTDRGNGIYDYSAVRGDAFIAYLNNTLESYAKTINGAASTIASTNLLADRALISNSTGKVAVSAVTSTELGYLDGVTSSIQTQLSNKADSSHTHTVANITNLQTILNRKSEWTQVWSGSINLNSYTNSLYSATVPASSYLGKRIAIEVQYGSGTTYTSKIIFGVLGSSSATAASTSISRGIGWSYFDGINLRVKTLYAYASASYPTTIYVGNLKTLFGTFSGDTIEWKTSHSETLYMKKIWVIE